MIRRVPFFSLSVASWAFWVAAFAFADETRVVDGREAISRATCEAGRFDYTSRFQPERSQGSQGQCFAFAAAGLMEEQLCVSDPADCQLQVSTIDLARDYPDRVNRYDPPIDGDPFDISRDYFNLQNANQGGVEYRLLDAALEFGVCEERNAPWFPRLEKKCRGMEDRSSCVIDGLKTQWRRYHRATRNVSVSSDQCRVRTDGAPLSERETSRIEGVLDQTEAYLAPQVEGGLDLELALRETSSEFEFVERVLIPPACEQNRLYPNGGVWLDRWSQNLVYQHREREQQADGSTVTRTTDGEATHESQYSNVERFQRLTSRVQENGRSVALGLCSKYAQNSSRRRLDDTRDGATCGPHALVANGVRWNPEKNRCEIHIRNSWGASTGLSGWLSIEPVLNSTFRVSGIRP